MSQISNKLSHGKHDRMIKLKQVSSEITTER